MGCSRWIEGHFKDTFFNVINTFQNTVLPDKHWIYFLFLFEYIVIPTFVFVSGILCGVSIIVICTLYLGTSCKLHLDKCKLHACFLFVGGSLK